MAYLSEWGIPIFRIDPGPTGLDAFGDFVTGLPIDIFGVASGGASAGGAATADAVAGASASGGAAAGGAANLSGGAATSGDISASGGTDAGGYAALSMLSPPSNIAVDDGFLFDDISFSSESFSAESFDSRSWFGLGVTSQRSSGGGKRRHDHERDKLFRDHWEYMDELRETQQKRDKPVRPAIQVQAADDIRGARTISIPVDMPVPESLVPRAMRGTVRPLKAGDLLHNPLVLAALALLIDADDD